MLIGRDREWALLDEMLSRAQSGESDSMLISGEPGIGKTFLLTALAKRALERGFRVLTAKGVEAESQIPCAALSDLFVTSRLLKKDPSLMPRLPAAQREALESALAIESAVNGDRFAVAAATLSLLAAAAEAGPLLCVVDDAQWIDASSAEPLTFTARRLRAEGVVMLFGVRSEDPGAARFKNLLHHELRLDGLDAVAARELVARGDALHSDVVDQVLATAAGNPLALLELPAALSDRERQGQSPIRSPLPLGPALEEAFAGRIRRLPPATQSALHVVAASDLPKPEVINAALELGGHSPADLDAAESSGLVIVNRDTVDFRHPLMRSAAYQCATSVQRRRAHRLLAEALADAVGVPQAEERRVWHLVAATLSPDDEVAAALEDAAAKAASQRSYAIAASLYERSAALSRTADARPGRLFAAGLAAIPAGRIDESIRLLGEALVLTEQPTARVRIEHRLCELQLWQRAPLTARDRMLELAAEVEESDRELAALLVLSAAQASIVMYDQPAVAAAAQWAARLAAGNDRLGLAASVIRAFAEAQAGHGKEAAAILDDNRSGLEGEDPLAVGQIVLQAAVCNLALERFAHARSLLGQAVSGARGAGAGGSLAMQLPWLALLDLADGRWMDALAEAHEAVRLIEETGWDTYRCTGLSVLARVEAGMGRAECVAHANAAIEAANRIGSSPVEAHAHAALGIYHLGAQSWVAAADEFEDALRLSGFSQAPLLRVQFLPDLIEASFRAARRDRAAELMAELAGSAAQMRRPSTLALAARCRGLLSRDDPEAHFRLALSDGDLAVSSFERARTALYYGDVLRRAKRRSEARQQFRQAYEEFERLGAAPWAERAGKWLDVSVTRGDQSRLQLTPQELQVALAVSKGMRNTEVAAALFLSVKTVEYHLRHVFEKVGVRSRTELVPRMSSLAPQVVTLREPETAGSER